MFLSEILPMPHTGLQSFGHTSIVDFVVVIVISIIETRLTTLSGLVTRLNLTRLKQVKAFRVLFCFI